MFLQHLVYATLVDTIRGCDVVLELPSPMSQPNVNRIIARQSVRYLHLRSLWIGPRGPIDKSRGSHKVIPRSEHATPQRGSRGSVVENGRRGCADPVSPSASANRRTRRRETEGSRVVLSMFFPLMYHSIHNGRGASAYMT